NKLERDDDSKKSHPALMSVRVKSARPCRGAAAAHVRFAPIATELVREKRTVAKCESRRNALQQKTASFNYLVGGNEQTRRHWQAKRLGRFDIESRYKLRCGLHRKVSGLGAAQDPVDVQGDLPKLVDPIHSVAHEPTCGDEEFVWISRQPVMLGRKRDDEIAMGVGRAIPWHDQATLPRVVREGSDGAFNISGVIPDWNEYRFDCERGRHRLGPAQVEIVIGSGLGIDHESRAC